MAREDLHNSVMEFARRYGADGLKEFFDSDKWNDFVKVLEAHLEDARDTLEIEKDLLDIRYVQGWVNALRTIIDASDVSKDLSKQLSEGMPTDELKDEENERGIEPENIV